MSRESGVVTIVHTDVAGSTELTRRLGDEAGRVVLDETKRIIREQIEARGGREIDAVGDATMSTFESTRQAIAAAIAVQRTLDEREREEPGSTLAVRIGINVGEVLERDGLPFGAAINAGARVMSKAGGGEILVSEVARQLAGSIAGVEYRDRGRHSFKGWEERWRLYEVIWRAPSEAPPPRPKLSARTRPGRRIVLLASAVVVGSVAVAVAVAALRAGDSSGLPRIDPQSVAVLDPDTGKILGEAPVGPRPRAIAVGAGSVWVANEGNQTVTRVDPSSLDTRTIALRGHPTDVTYARGSVWVVTLEGGLIQIEPQFNSAAEPIRVRAPRSGIPASERRPEVVSAGGALWVSDPPTALFRVSAAGGRRRVTPDSGTTGPLAAGGGELWVAGNAGIAPVDPVSGLVDGAVVAVSGNPTSVDYGAAALWTANGFRNVLQRIDPTSRAVTSTAGVGRNPTCVAVGAGAVWVTNQADGTLTRQDLRGGEPRTIHVGGSPSAVEVSEDGVWVTSE